MSLPFEFIDQVFGEAGPKVIAEIGAADGIDTVRYAKRYPRAHIHAFEPLTRNVESLRAAVTTAAVGSHVTIHPTALSDENRVSVDFWVSGGSPHGAAEPWPYSSSLFAPKEHLCVHPWCTFEKAHTSTVRLDNVLRDPPDYIHMDVQGAELKVLAGAAGLLPDVQAVWLEVANVELYESQPLTNDVNMFMVRAGFRCRMDTTLGPSGDQFWSR